MVRIKADQDFYVQDESTLLGTANDGSLSGKATRMAYLSGWYDLTGSGSITAADSASSTATGAGSQSIISGTPTAGSTVSIAADGRASVSVQVSGTFTGTLQFERSIDGTNWTAVNLQISGVSTAPVSTTTQVGAFHGNIGAISNFRVRATAWTSGTATISIRTGQGLNLLTTGINATLASPVAVRLSDGSAALTALTTVSRVPTEITATYTRPADTTAYTGATSSAPGDALSNSTSSPTALTFSNTVLANNGGARLERWWCYTSQATMAGVLRLHLFKGNSAPTATNDNAASTSYSISNYLGYVDFAGFTPYGGGAIAAGLPDSLASQAIQTGGTTSIFGLAEVRTGFTPASGQTFQFNAQIDQV